MLKTVALTTQQLGLLKQLVHNETQRLIKRKDRQPPSEYFAELGELLTSLESARLAP